MLAFELSLVFLFAYFLAILASFFNVVIWRTAREESFVGGRSRCEHCQHQLSWADNLPLLSFFLLGGKCRYCQHSIAKKHFISELLAFSSGWLFYLAYLFVPTMQALSATELITYFLCLFVLAFIVWADLQYLLVPDFLVALLTVLALVLLFLGGSAWQLPLLATTVALGFFALLYLLSKKLLAKEALGLGDLKLMVPLALLLSWPLILVNIFLAFILGGLFAMIVLVTGQKKLGQALPFAPFLVFAALLSFIYGQTLIAWYLNFLF
jgi:leader peptidase (prepilin peptidase) / N-methyltransferase